MRLAEHLVVERTYSVSTREAEFGLLSGTSKVCHRALLERDAACVNCPVSRGARGAGVIGVSGAGAFLIAVGRRVGVNRADVTQYRVPPELFAQLLDARVHVAAGRARLSRRESEVLEHLIRGRTLATIAGQLGISERTAKYHQANVLQKLGAASRLDLFRLLLD